MKQRLIASALLALGTLATIATPTHAIARMSTVDRVANTPVFGVYHDVPTGFVFVRQPSGWVFVGKDEQATSHRIYRDGPTGFVFVKLSTGWKFVPATV